MTQDTFELASLRLIRKSQTHLAHALNSIAGKRTEAEVSYLIWGAIHINKLIDGYCRLRKHNRHASKILIRPVIEMLFSIAAALQNPSFFFRKVHHEFKEAVSLNGAHRQLIEKRAENDAERKQLLTTLDNEKEVMEKEFSRFEKWFLQTRGQHRAVRERWRADLAAQEGGLADWYGHYKTYCQFTHGALHAVTGAMDASTDPSDNRVMLWHALMVLGLLERRAPVQLPELESLRRKAKDLLY